MREWVNRFPGLKNKLSSIKKKWFRGEHGEGGVERLAAHQFSDVSGDLRDAWKHDDIPKRQRKIVDAELSRFKRGKPVKVFDVMVSALQGLPLSGSDFSILDIGCASGFYSEVFAIAQPKARYVGCDYSEALIESARDTYRDVQFDVEDATQLSYPDGAFDVALSGCCLLHIPEYEVAIRESVRVASKYVIFHRTQVVVGASDNHYFKKTAYGVDMVEIHFGEVRFLEALRESGLSVISTQTLHQLKSGAEDIAVRTYVCRKVMDHPARKGARKAPEPELVE
ncbi:class I SAM-dependent methyltransferase [Pandoraea sp. NPDC087047]|uniref:class I SAM-dependent methyltransferase n=1 Tax=Pandoraea sp. NPDC087047 TaxID=3364390 RepID=UPI00382FDFA4